ncbi:aquaporin AQPAn.G-like isoform X4 [Schistocerca gregaria]|uniref:aquaporin AQPAn.G-like isoform X4 n=1 Tax=Schistocerca gregaria TaxID=7010 RepID=UPI00211E2DFD|nr:aquaporin AQPAn.G-like isoform X4 [Schistocerca gregaria]
MCYRALKAAFGRDPDTGSLFGKLSPRRMLVVFCAELLGTALLLFMGCMGTVTGVSDAPSSPLQISIAFGMTVASIIQVIGHISVAHINPSVTLCAVLRGDLNVAAAFLYFVAQNIGAILGFGLLLSVTPSSAVCECTTVPAKSLSALQSVLVEAGMTAVLILLCHGVWDARNARNTDSTPLKFGFLVAAVSMVSGPYTGGSMNPARTLGPAVWRGEWTQHWVYWVGPLLGSAVASLLYLTLFDAKPAASTASRNRRGVEDGAAGTAGTEKAESIPLN